MNWALYEGFVPLAFAVLVGPWLALAHLALMRPCRHCHGSFRVMREREGRAFDARCDCFGGSEFRWFS